MELTPTEKLKKAKAGLVLDHPFWGSLMIGMQYKADPEAETAWTDGKTIGYSEKFFSEIRLNQVKTVIAHEAGGHVGFCHHTRRGGRSPKKWNRATDHVVNLVLKDCGFEPIDGWYCDPQYKGMTAEAVYAKLPDEPGDNDGTPDPRSIGDVKDAKGKDGGPAGPADMEQAEAEAKVRVAQAAAVAKACGKLPASLKRLIEDVLEPSVDWRTELRRFLAQAARNDYTWKRPNPRYISGGLYLPALYSEEMPPIAVAVDTSGSIDQKVINQFSSEINAIRDEAGANEITVIFCDTEVAGVQKFENGEPITLDAQGGGGTDFVPPFVWIEENGETPAAMIYLTDGYCSSFPPAPDYPVLWAVTGEIRDFAPPFGEVIKVKEIY